MGVDQNGSEVGGEISFADWQPFDEDRWDRLSRQLGSGRPKILMAHYVAGMIARDPEELRADMLHGKTAADQVRYSMRDNDLVGVLFLRDIGSGSEEEELPQEQVWAGYDVASDQFLNLAGVGVSREQFEQGLDEMYELRNDVSFWAINNVSSYDQAARLSEDDAR